MQTVFQISDNTGLALTTYHYYTPSGRLIQRNYDHVSLYDYYYVRDDAAPANKSNLEVKLTDSGRTVYGGGGITPDEKITNIKSNHFQDNLLIHYAFFNFSKHYLASHAVAKDFTVDDAVMQQFKDFLKTNQIEYTDQDVASSLDWVKESIKSELFTLAVRSVGRHEGAGPMGSAGGQGCHLHPRGSGTHRSCQSGGEDHDRQPLGLTEPLNRKAAPTGAAFSCSIFWSGRPGSNRRHSAWEADVLPLNYSRLYKSIPCRPNDSLLSISVQSRTEAEWMISSCLLRVVDRDG